MKAKATKPGGGTMISRLISKSRKNGVIRDLVAMQIHTRRKTERMIANSEKNGIVRDMAALLIYGRRRGQRITRIMKRFVVRSAGSVC